MSERYVFGDGSSERRYTKNEARAILGTRWVVVILTCPFVIALRAVVGSDYFNWLPEPKSIRLIGGEFYP